MKKFINLIIYFFIILTLTSCYDNKELEDRAFSITLGIDFVNDSYLTVLEIKNTNEDEKNIIVQGTGDTILQSIEKVNLTLDKEVYFGQTKLLILGKNLLEDKTMLMKALDFFDRTTIINKKIIVTSTGEDLEEVFDSSFVGSELGIYFSHYFKNNVAHNGTKITAEEIISNLRVNNSCLIPKITLEDDELKVKGCYLLKDYKIIDEIDDELLLYYLIFQGDGVNRYLSVDFEDKKIPLEIIKTTDKINVVSNNDRINIILSIKIKGYVEEFILEDDSLDDQNYLRRLEDSFETQIQDNIKKIYNLFCIEYKCDELKLINHIKKFNYDLYEKKLNNIDNPFSVIDFSSNIDVTITNTGSKK